MKQVKTNGEMSIVNFFMKQNFGDNFSSALPKDFLLCAYDNPWTNRIKDSRGKKIGSWYKKIFLLSEL